MFIDREVIEDFYREPDRVYQDDTVGTGAAIFECEVVNGAYLTEDYGFCHQVRQRGHKIVCDPSIVVTHYGMCRWHT